MKKVVKFSVLVCIVITWLTVITGTVFAAKTVEVITGQVSITDSTGTGSITDGVYKATVTGSSWLSATNSITILNSSDSRAEISFSYKAEGCSSFSIDGSSVASGTYSVTLDKGSSVKLITIKAEKKTTATLTLTDIRYKEMSAVKVNVKFDKTLGTVTAAGVNVETGETVVIGSAGVELNATPINGAEFIGWVDEKGYIRSKNATYTQVADTMTTLEALFYKDSKPFFMIDDKYIFNDLNTAANSGTKVVLMRDAVLASGNYTIPSGTTLLIPFDDANTMYKTKPGSDDSTYTNVKPKLYRTLTMVNGAKITVNGAISISAKQSRKIGYNGAPVGTYGLVSMEDGSTITVNSGGNLYVWGYIAGSGNITAKSGATVYEDFQVRDWRGGDATSRMIDNTQRVFPMSQYYVQNIQVPLTLEAGAIENGYMTITVTLLGEQGSSIPFIGPDGMFKINSGSVTKDYDEATDRLVIDVNGMLDMSSISLSMNLGLLIGTKTISSQKYTLPINGNITLNVNSGSKVNISQDMALLPGGIINVHGGAECTVSPDSKIFIYDSEEWGKYHFPHSNEITPVVHVHDRKYTRSDLDVVDAEIRVEGVVDASDGNVYVTESGSNIYGVDGGLVKLKSDPDTTVTYYATQDGNSNVSYHEIPITTAKIKNDDGTYIDPETVKCCLEYKYSNGEWTPIFSHSFADFSCSVCGAQKIATSTEYNITGENISINTSLILDVPTDTQIIIATYNSDMKLLEASCKTAATLEEITFSSVDVAMIKVFAWDGVNVMTPISIVEEIEL